ncbi:MAG: acetolactate synthase [Phycisphaeraceae bacterium]|nr:acetolactate synthase [Phycisphaeraceae bacterium]
MADLPTSDVTAMGFEPPRNTQFSVFLDNRVGKLLELVDIFDGQALTVAGLSVVDSADHAVVRLLTSRAELARRLLDRHSLPCSETEVLVVEVTPTHSLRLLCKSLLSAEINIQYAYPLLARPHGHPALAIHCDEPYVAMQILQRKMFHLLAENDLGDNLNPGDPYNTGLG